MLRHACKPQRKVGRDSFTNVSDWHKKQILTAEKKQIVTADKGCYTNLWSVHSFSQDSSLSVITFLGQTAAQMLIKEKKLVQYHSSTNSGGYSFDTVCWCHKKRGGRRRRPQCRNRQQKQHLVFPAVRRDSEEHWEEKIIERNILICNRVNKSQLYL